MNSDKGRWERHRNREKGGSKTQSEDRHLREGDRIPGGGQRPSEKRETLRETEVRRSWSPRSSPPPPELFQEES